MQILTKEEYIKIFQPKSFLLTGLYPFDFEIMKSGLPSSRFIILSGESGAGKSTFIIHLLKKLYNENYEIYIIDTEGAFSFGFEDFNFKAVDINCIEELLEFFSSLEDLNKKVFVWDTITNTPTKKMLKGEDFGIAEQSRVLSMFFKAITYRILKSDCFFFGVLEKREQIQPFKPAIDQFFSGVGNSVKAVPSILLYFYSTKEDIENSIFKVSITAYKNRFGKTYHKAEVFMQGGKGYLEKETFLNYLKNQAEKDGRNYVFDKENPVFKNIDFSILDIEIKDNKIRLSKKQLDDLIDIIFAQIYTRYLIRV